MTAKTKPGPSNGKPKKGMGQFVAPKPAAAPKRKASAGAMTAAPIATDETPAQRRPGQPRDADYAADEAELGRSLGRSSRRIFDERKPLITRLSPEQHRRLRQLALDLNTTVQDLVVEALSTYLVEKRGLDPL